MKVEDIQQIAVIGVGEIGHQIAQEFAMTGYDVHLNDVSEEKLQQALVNIRRNLQFLVDNDFITSQRIESTMKHCHTKLAMQDAVYNADIVVEAVYENVDVKQQLFQRLDALCPDRTILASNSSTIVPSLMASKTRRPQQVLVAHYINPPYLMPVVELVRAPDTSDDTVNTMYELYQHIGKTPVIVQKEVPGFLVNRLQGAIWREALYMAEEGIASPEDLDKVMTHSFGRRLSTIGYFELADHVAGLDLSLIACNLVFPHLYSSSDVPPILQKKVQKGELGVKTGKGFYEWTPESADALRQKLLRNLVSIAKWDKQKR